MSKPGFYVEMKDGTKGRTYHDDTLAEGKIKVYKIDHRFKPTGEKLLCKSSNLKIIGYID